MIEENEKTLAYSGLDWAEINFSGSGAGRSGILVFEAWRSVEFGVFILSHFGDAF